MNRLARLAAVLAFVMTASVAQAKTFLLVTGIFGEIISPMVEIETALKAKGHKVIRAPWWLVPRVHVDGAIGHSAGADAVLRMDVKRIVSIDPTFLNAGCRRDARCMNFYAPEDKLPFLICCGGYRASGAKNIRVRPGHTSMPRRISRDVVREAIR